MSLIDVKSSSYAEYNVDSNDKDHKLKIGNHVSISQYKNIFAKRYPLNLSEAVLVISKIKNTIPWTYIINDLNSDEKWKDYDNSFNSWIDRKDIV